MADPRRILIVEDDPDLAELARLHLADEGYAVEVRHDGTAGLERALAGLERADLDLLVVDLMLPGTDGLEICRQVRAAERYLPILILTAKGSELDRVLGLELGADDYLTKPASLRELVARVRALLRMSERLGQAADPGAQAALERGRLVIEPASRRVRLGAEQLDLTTREFDLLHFLALHPGRVYNRDQLVEGVWGYGYEGYEHTVNSHINRLRKKLGPAAACIETVWGVGYRFGETGA